MYASVGSSYLQTRLTLSVAPCKGTDTAGSLTTALLGRLVRQLRIAQARRDLVAIITLQAAIRKESAR